MKHDIELENLKKMEFIIYGKLLTSHQPSALPVCNVTIISVLFIPYALA